MVRRYYDRYRRYGRRSRGVGFLPKIILVLCVLGALFLYRNAILQWLDENPATAKYVPGFVTSALERDLEDWKEEDLEARYAQLTTELQNWQSSLSDAAKQGQDKLNEVQENINATRQALEDTKTALDNLSQAGADLKGSFSTERQ